MLGKVLNCKKKTGVPGNLVPKSSAVKIEKVSRTRPIDI